MSNTILKIDVRVVTVHQTDFEIFFWRGGVHRPLRFRNVAQLFFRSTSLRKKVGSTRSPTKILQGILYWKVHIAVFTRIVFKSKKK